MRAVLQVIADFTGLNIITSDTVTGSLTLRLKDIPWDQALDIIMQTKGLDMRKNGNVVLIAPREELAVKEKQQLEAQAADQRAGAADDRSRSSSTTSRRRTLQRHLDATAASARRRRGERTTGGPGLDHLGSAASRIRRSAHQHPVRARTPRRGSRKCAGSSGRSTRPVRQVLIESRIVIASDKFSRQLGVRLGVADRVHAAT